MSLLQDRTAAAADLARRARAGVTDRWDAATVDATVVVALARSGDLAGVGEHLARVPPGCPLYRAACHELLTAEQAAPIA